jgi:hypothetical protein
VVITVNWGVGTSSRRVASVDGTCVIIIARNGRCMATSSRITIFISASTVINANYGFVGTTGGGITAIGSTSIVIITVNLIIGTSLG